MITQLEKLAFELGTIRQYEELKGLDSEEKDVIKLCEKIGGMNAEHGLAFYKALTEAQVTRVSKECETQTQTSCTKDDP